MMLEYSYLNTEMVQSLWPIYGVDDHGHHWRRQWLVARRQSITWTNDILLPIRPLRTSFIAILITLQQFSFQ